ncbi:hypothetical protein Pint_26751 [Pistacia integerrima]|uniref:Uncharacterized protein n=1 Tax=Pistacia integerrima TaxID=434235 RepID=A0ACC0YTS9_9ROSI|nr:hypothetical protein Pint_26751 [Pistacia integerrima]
MASSSSSSSSSSTTPLVIKKYDVFINFRGEDTRYCFASILRGLLLDKDKDITVFFDDELEKGDEISSSLMNAIEESAISIVIISKRSIKCTESEWIFWGRICQACRKF